MRFKYHVRVLDDKHAKGASGGWGGMGGGCSKWSRNVLSLRIPLLIRPVAGNSNRSFDSVDVAGNYKCKCL